ncbi:DNA topoisomerase [Scheffersomyces xylosifermentans]|uniref:DNA topoisomerase n=1 Tax=Scheffersomyces xylosifermentans TaxID=1304137 RepID=UPI00315DDCC9
MKILCVAEKPSIAKEVSKILSGGRFTTRNSKNKYIKNYDFKFNFPNFGTCDVTMTSVVGHMTNLDFPPSFQWGKCVPGRLFDADIIEKITKPEVFENIAKEAKNSHKLMIWTDCDREGEFIGFEIFKAASKGNCSIQVADIWRSRFSHLERNHILSAASNPIQLDMNAINAVACRMEVDFRVGTSFTRLLTDNLRQNRIIEKGELASYGTCQFPTLGFVVDRYKRVKNFIPEKFWYISVEIRKQNQKTNFTWTKGRYFDRLYVALLYQECLNHDEGIITKIESKGTTNWRPLPLTTVELQKDCSRIFKMSAKRALDAAEKLYNKGFISYPRTETDKFPDSMDLRAVFEKQTGDVRWGPYAAKLLAEGHERPRNGSHDDKAHPAIHPVNYVQIDSLTAIDEKKVYEYVVRRFLACCSKDAVGSQTSATLQWGSETFTATGLVVLERNYLDVYIYKKWESTKQLPLLSEGERIKIWSGMMTEGKTSPPNHMTEPELIALMDANGIGTDATIAEHIEKIANRGYIAKQKRGNTEFIVPSPLGMGLIEGFEQMDFENISLSKPFLRKLLENSLQQIVDGQRSKDDVLSEVKQIYRQAYGISSQNITSLAQICRTIMAENQ